MKNWIKNRINSYKELIDNNFLYSKIEDVVDTIVHVRNKNCKILIAGNGASNTISTHAALDFTNQLAIPCLSFNDASVITAFSNDFGYENSIKRFIKLYSNDDDCFIFVSSSGESENVIRAAEFASTKGKVITFTGFNKNNRLKNLGDINFWVNSINYNVVENIHMIWLSTICDVLAHKEKEFIGTHGRKL